MSGERSTLRVDFLAADAGQAPLTWGQSSIWRPLRALPSSSFNFKRVVATSPGVTLEFAAAALRRLIERHQSLRAHFLPGEPPQQRIEAAGSYEVDVVDVALPNVPDAAESAVARLASTAFDLETEWPARVVCVQAEGMVQSIGIVTSHVATDYFAIGLLVAELRQLLANVEPLPPPSWQPLDQAEFEASPLGLRRSERSLQHWRKLLAAAPDRVFATERGSGEPIPFQSWVLTSPAIAWASSILAERTRTSSSTVLLTASALVLRAASHRENVALKVIAGNRYSPRERALVAPNCNDGIFVCAPESGDVASVIVRSHSDATAAYLNAFYDPDALRELTAQLARERGAPLDLSAYFNDSRLVREWRKVPDEQISHDEMARLRAKSELVPGRSLSQTDMTFCITVFSRDEALAIVTLLADTRWLSADACRRSLLAFEELLCEAALRPMEMSELSALVQRH